MKKFLNFNKSNFLFEFIVFLQFLSLEGSYKPGSLLLKRFYKNKHPLKTKKAKCSRFAAGRPYNTYYNYKDIRSNKATANNFLPITSFLITGTILDG